MAVSLIIRFRKKASQGEVKAVMARRVSDILPMVGFSLTSGTDILILIATCRVVMTQKRYGYDVYGRMSDDVDLPVDLGSRSVFW